MRCPAALFCLLALTGCQTGYYLHLAGGHSRLMLDREPVERVLAEARLSDELAQRLALTPEMLDFAEHELALPVGRAYRRFVHLQRDWVVWNLVAAPEFSLEPHRWCYPIAGCNSYRGYYNLKRAERDAERLRERGLQVYGGGAVAYSTLGWFADPLTTPMLVGDETWIAELLFHELAHRRFWLRGDTAFNESLATSVGREGLRRWLVARDEADLITRMHERDRARAQVLRMVNDIRDALEQLYASDMPEATMRERRDQLIAELRHGFAQARSEDQALARYQRWFDGPLNNAQLATFNDYNQWVPAFDQLLLECAGHWACFWQQVERLAAFDPEPRRAALEQLHDRTGSL